MGRLSQLGGVLGLATALHAGESLAQDAPERETLKSYSALTTAPALELALNGKDILTNPPFTATAGSLEDLSPKVLEGSFFIAPLYTYNDAAEAMGDHYDLNLLIQSGANYVDYDVFAYSGEDSNGKFYSAVTNPSYCNRLNGGKYSGFYEINHVRFYVVSADDKEFTCPQEVVTLREDTSEKAKVAVDVPSPSSAPLNLSLKVAPAPEPTAPAEHSAPTSRFADLDPALFKNGVFLVPVRVIKPDEEVPPELSGEGYVTNLTQGGTTRTIYRKYTLEVYAPQTGILKVRDAGDSSKCMETKVFESYIIGDPSQYILPVPGSSDVKDVACEEAAEAPKPSKESKSWEMPVRFSLGGGGDVEETSEYSLGNAPAVHVSAQVQPFSIPLMVGVSGDFIFTPDGSGLEGVDLRVGGQPIQKVPVRGYLTVGDSFEARDRYSETTLNGALSYGALVDGDLYKFKLLDQAWAINCYASAQQHLYGGGGLSVWNPALGCGLAWDTVVSGVEREKKERPVVSDAAVSAVAVKAQPKGPHLEMETKPYTYEIPVLKETKDEEKKAKRTQLSEEMRKKSANNGWDAVEHSYDDLDELKIPLSFGTYITGAQAARALGDIEESYERVLRAQSVAVTAAEKKETADWIADVEPRYASVEITVDVDGEVTFAPVDYGAFAPDIRAATAFVQAELAKDGSFEGFLPTSEGTIQITYTLNGQVIGELPPVSSKVTTEIRLEK